MPSLPILTYGEGANRVTLQLGHLGPVRIRACYGPDGTQYLYHHLDISCDFLVNPEATQPPGGNFPGRGDPRLVEHGWMPSEAIPRLHRLLLLPRQKLIISRGDRVLLESPQPGRRPGQRYDCDANNGPNPIDCTFTDFVGDRTVRGAYRIETWIRYAPLDPALRTPTVIGHEWDVSSHLDDEFLTTRTISGRVTLRRDILLSRFTNQGNALRAQDLFPTLGNHAVPEGYKRTSVDVRYTSDGTGIAYTIVDVQKPWGVTPKLGVLRVEGSQMRSFDWISSMTPTLSQHLHLEVYGYPTSSSANLVRVLSRLYATIRGGDGKKIGDRNLGGGGDVKVGMWQRASIRVDFPRRRATLDSTVTVSSALGAINAAGQIVGVSPQVDDPDVYANDFGDFGGPREKRNPGVGWNNLVADPLLRLVTQQLVRGYEAPALPGTPRAPINATP